MGKGRSGRWRGTPALASLGLAVIVGGLLGAVDLWVFRNVEALAQLEARTAGEVVLGELFASLRDHDDFGSAIESSASLKAKVLGLGLYASTGEGVYAFGEVPARFEAPASVTAAGPAAATTSVGAAAPAPAPAPGGHGPSDRVYRENPARNSVILLVQPFALLGPPPRPPKDGPAPGIEAPPRPHGEPAERDHPFLFTTLKRAEVVYLEISQPEYWRDRRLRAVLFPLSGLLIVALLAFVRSLYLRNREYRLSLEEQRSLVVLGTAASTLAHEIKNPLLSIRLQSSILEKTCPEEARRELGIINAEVERLSALTYRVNDWLREPVGRPLDVDLGAFLREVATRLLGAEPVEILGSGPHIALVDPDRLRSVAENLLRNALESGSPPEGLHLEVWGKETEVGFDVLDRGSGIPPGDRARVFDPFFTTKSRGSGIGLAISRRFVEAAGGHIDLDGREGGGTRVRVGLPRAADREGAPRARKEGT